MLTEFTGLTSTNINHVYFQSCGWFCSAHFNLAKEASFEFHINP